MDAAHPASLAPAVADESAAQDAVRLDVRAKCQAEARDCLLAMDLDFQKVSAVRLDAAVRSGAQVFRDARGQFPTQQPPAALQKAEYSREPRRPAEPMWLPVVKRER